MRPPPRRGERSHQSTPAQQTNWHHPPHGRRRLGRQKCSPTLVKARAQERPRLGKQKAKNEWEVAPALGEEAHTKANAGVGWGELGMPPPHLAGSREFQEPLGKTR